VAQAIARASHGAAVFFFSTEHVSADGAGRPEANPSPVVTQSAISTLFCQQQVAAVSARLPLVRRLLSKAFSATSSNGQSHAPSALAMPLNRARRRSGPQS
jgi:hypothetical protein